MPIIVTVEQMCEFIMQQLPERKINFAESLRHGDCGCLMVHYGIANKFQFNSCSLSSWENDDSIAILCHANGRRARYSLFIPDDESGNIVWRTTYEEVQKLVPRILGNEIK